MGWLTTVRVISTVVRPRWPSRRSGPGRRRNGCGRTSRTGWRPAQRASRSSPTAGSSLAGNQSSWTNEPDEHRRSDRARALQPRPLARHVLQPRRPADDRRRRRIRPPGRATCCYRPTARSWSPAPRAAATPCRTSCSRATARTARSTARSGETASSRPISAAPIRRLAAASSRTARSSSAGYSDGEARDRPLSHRRLAGHVVRRRRHGDGRRRRGGSGTWRSRATASSSSAAATAWSGSSRMGRSTRRSATAAW